MVAEPRCPACGGTRQAFPEQDGVLVHADNGCPLCDLEGRSWGGVLQGDMLTRLAELRAGSVSCAVTSPPFWSLRRYPTEDVVWGGDPGCEHEWGDVVMGGESYNSAIRWEHGDPDKAKSRKDFPDAWQKQTPQGSFCVRCGCWRGQFGLEPTPELYVEHTLDVLRAIRRVLRDDGVVWWNIGDGYWAGKGTGGSSKARATQVERGWKSTDSDMPDIETRPQDGQHPTIKPKDLVLMPFRVALAAQRGGGWAEIPHDHLIKAADALALARETQDWDLVKTVEDALRVWGNFGHPMERDGWYVRSVIIWSKPNAMPESTKDRPTTAHEYVLMLTKKARYWWDQEAIREPHTAAHLQQQLAPNTERGESRQFGKQGLHDFVNPNGRNCRSVWTFPTAQTPEAHFATFPPELPRRCISAATPKAICAKCGTARVRLVEDTAETVRSSSETLYPKGSTGNRISTYRQGNRATYGQDTRPTPRTTGWSDCPCPEPDYQPGIVLDPFAGVGTTLYVARQLGRRFIGIELSKTYAQMARQKLSKWWDPPNLAPRHAPAGQSRMEGV